VVSDGGQVVRRGDVGGQVAVVRFSLFAIHRDSPGVISGLHQENDFNSKTGKRDR